MSDSPTDAVAPVILPAESLAPDAPDGDSELLSAEAEALALIYQASQKVERLRAEHEAAKEVASGRKKAYEAAVEELQSVIASHTRPLPLFDVRHGAEEEDTPSRSVTPSPRTRNEQDNSWRKDLLLHALQGVSSSVLAALVKAELHTVGDLADYSEQGNHLVDIPGIGASKATQIEEAMDAYWARRAERIASSQPQ